jgi:hypothetical protein
MERERLIPQPSPPAVAGASEHDLDEARRKLEGLLAAAETVLDATDPLLAEEYLQQSRQRGGQ